MLYIFQIYTRRQREGFQRAIGKPFGRARELFCQGKFVCLIHISNKTEETTRRNDPLATWKNRQPNARRRVFQQPGAGSGALSGLVSSHVEWDHRMVIRSLPMLFLPPCNCRFQGRLPHNTFRDSKTVVPSLCTGENPGFFFSAQRKKKRISCWRSCLQGPCIDLLALRKELSLTYCCFLCRKGISEAMWNKCYGFQ